MATQTPLYACHAKTDSVLENCYSLSRKVPTCESSSLQHTISRWLAVIPQSITSKDESWQQHLCMSIGRGAEVRLQLLSSILFPGTQMGRTMNHNTVYETQVATGDTVETVSPHGELADAVHHGERHFATLTRRIEPHSNLKGHLESTDPSERY